jgi:hypothetical protein
LDPDDPDNVDPQLVELRVVEHVSRALEQLDRFGMGISHLPERELDLKLKFLPTEFDAAIEACMALLDSYHGILDKVEDAVRPLLGLISFDAGGQSDFYARWFPGLNNLLARDRLITEYRLAIERLQVKMVTARQQQEEEVKEALLSWLTPERLASAEATSPHIKYLVSESLVDVLASAYIFLNSLSASPSWFHELERRIFHGIDEKKAQAQLVIAAGKS